jgi:hypothetical protein
MNPRIYLIISLVVNVLLLCLCIRSCHNCPPCVELVGVSNDTTWRYVAARDTALRHVPHRLPVGRRKLSAYLASTSADTCISSRDTTYYTDTLYAPDAYRALIADTIAHNTIIGRGISIADLKPTAIQTIQTTRSLIVKPRALQLSVGAVGLVGGRSGYTSPYPSWDIGPSLLLNIHSQYQISYSYYTQNNLHAVGAYVKLIFKKQP